MVAGAGLKRSRALWQKARQSHSENVHNNSGDSNSSRHPIVHILICYARAILYELQPIRWSVVMQQLPQWRRELTRLGRGAAAMIQENGPIAVQWLVQFLKSLRPRHYGYAVLAVLYYAAVRWLHETLEAGPMVMILTALVLIFTIGLSDKKENGDDEEELSAYAVFNRGFARLLGTVQEDDLLRQHLGGGMLGAAMMGNQNNNHNNIDDDENWAARPQQQQRNRRQRDQQQRQQQQQQQQGQNEQQQQQQQQQPPPQPRRRAGKKARRVNLEQRRERQRQREAAAAMGFVGDDANGGDERERQAMQHLLEEQIAIMEARGNDHDEAHELIMEDDDDDDNDNQQE